MTIVCWDGKTLAADSQVTRGSTRYGYINKIYKLTDGRYIGCCGHLSDVLNVREWLNSDKTIEKPKVESGFACIIVNTLTGEAIEMYDSLIEEECPVPAAQGCAFDIAMGVMIAGGSAVKAVEVCKKLNVYIGGDINTVSYEGV